MSKKEFNPPYTEIEIDCFPEPEWKETLDLFFRSLTEMGGALNKSSDLSIEGGAGFHWKLKITAKGEWV